MRIAPILLVNLAAGVLAPTLASAEPEFRWLNDWQYKMTTLDASGPSSFGSTTADTATGGSDFEPPPTTSGGGAFTDVTFSRMFGLSGDPQGWDVKMNAQVTGQFVHIRADLLLDFSAMIGGTGYSIDYQFEPPGGPPSGSIFGSPGLLDNPRVLADGVYTISGINRASLAGTAPSGGITASLNDTFSLTLNATPRAVPEPTSVALLGLGGVGAWLVLGRRPAATT